MKSVIKATAGRSKERAAHAPGTRADRGRDSGQRLRSTSTISQRRQPIAAMPKATSAALIPPPPDGCSREDGLLRTWGSRRDVRAGVGWWRPRGPVLAPQGPRQRNGLN
jgi:hypothetical protein